MVFVTFVTFHFSSMNGNDVFGLCDCVLACLLFCFINCTVFSDEIRVYI